MKNTTRTKAGLAAAGIGLGALFAAAATAQNDVASMTLSEADVKRSLGVKLNVVETLAFHPKLIKAVLAQNAEGLSLEEIQKRDGEWKDPASTLRHGMINSETSSVLRRLVSDNATYTEAFLTDNQGANVAAFPPTSDYWQGDEEKWTASFNDGDGTAFIGPVEFDESTRTQQVQISVPVIDVQADKTIGVLVVGVNLDYILGAQR